jgi:hypothetical protein
MSDESHYKLSTDQKVNILLNLLNEKNSRIAGVRERYLKIITTSSTIFLLLVGWIVQKQSTPELTETIFLSCLILVFWIGNLFVFRDLKKAYINECTMKIRIEQCLYLYQPNVFTSDGSSFYPQEWQSPTDAGHFRIFDMVFSSIALISIVILTIESLVT